VTAPIRRILVGVDASPLGLAALDAAFTLAARLGAECDAVFVADVNLARLVSHPHVHTYSLASARRHPVDGATLARALELQQATARHAHRRAAEIHRVGGAFIVRQGRVAAELLDAAPAADLICLGWSGRARPGRLPRLGSTTRRLLAEAPRPVLALRHPASGPVMALWDGSEPSRRALAIAAALAAGAVDLLIPDNDPVTVLRLEAAAQDLLAEMGATGRHRTAGRLARCLAGAAADGVLVAAGVPVDEVACSLLAVR